MAGSAGSRGTAGSGGPKRGDRPSEPVERLPVDRLPAIASELRAAARRFGTPLYLTDEASLAAATDELRAAFPDPWIRQYSVKANDASAVIRLATAAGRGMGANVVSRGEWAAARAAGLTNDRITLEGVGKADADLAAAVRATTDGRPLLWTAIESADEAQALAGRARRAGLGTGGKPALDVLVRLNPDVVPETLAGLAVGAGGSKFGMTETELTAVVERLASGGGVGGGAGSALRVRGIQIHVGSQLGAIDAWRDSVRKALALLGLLRGGLPDLDTLDVGGGFGVPPLGERGPRPERFARELPALLEAIPADRRPRRFAIEPGRFVVARAGWLVGRVLHVRERAGPQVVLDTGMTELIRPALYGGMHPIVALTSLGRPVDGAQAGHTPTDVHGPICESTDELGSHHLPPLRRGDLVAIRDAGAYGASLSSTYNGRPRPPQVVLIADGRLVLARHRGSLRP